MATIIDVILPIFTLIIGALLTIPVFKIARKSNHKNAITLAWLVAVIAIAIIGVANLSISYFSVSNPEPLNLGINGETNSPYISSFLIDALSLYMAIIIAAVSIVIVIYSVLFINSAERPTDRYFAVMLMLTAALLGAVLAGDL
jgi:NADH:ubiquinone oxidoreductase subunit 5 (subunit L)/multisubunit Na+/H+ antiporter MnhA subunit